MSIEQKPLASEKLHPDHEPYLRFTGPSRLEKSINSLLGLVEGIAADAVISDGELAFLQAWLRDHAEVRLSHPYNEFMPVVEAAIADRVITNEERADIIWLCEKLRSAEYFDAATADMQRLHGMLGGIAADGTISVAELKTLSDWLQAHEHLRRCWPYDEVDSLVTAVLRDGRIDEDEHRLLMDHFSEFVIKLDDRTITNPLVQQDKSLFGVCAVCPEITFEDAHFCFTGASARFTRKEFSMLVETLGGRFSGNVTAKVHYLVIGAEGNPCWAFACYGRKVEQAVKLRKDGARLLLVHEHDFHDAVADAA